jgi:hypothetical protein
MMQQAAEVDEYREIEFSSHESPFFESSLKFLTLDQMRGLLE